MRRRKSFAACLAAAPVPTAAEPFFHNLNASIELMPVMNLDDMRAGIEKALKNA